jgi:hypothetical protein
MNCLWDTWATIYFPAASPWSVDLIRDLEEAFHGRIEFLASDGTDPYVPTEPTEATEAPTEEPTTVPPTTVPPATQAPTEAATAPADTQPETLPGEKPDPIIPPTEPEAPEKSGGSKIGFIIIGAVGIFLILGSIVFGGGRKKGRYSR